MDITLGPALLSVCLLLAMSAHLAAAESASIPLTEETYGELTNDRPVFLKMHAPWCGHCKALAPAWEQLAEDWRDGPGLVGEVDCTDPAAEMLCERFNVEGFPTLLYGDPTAPDDYQGPRDYDSLAAFAKTFLDKPVCSVTREEACGDAERAVIRELKATAKEDLLESVQQVESQVRELQKDLNDFIESINEQYDMKTQEFNQRIQALHAETNYKWLQQVLQKVHGVYPPRPAREAAEEALSDDLLGGSEL